MKRLALLLLLTMVLPSCASIVEGRTQEVEVMTQPPGAQCQLLRDGEIIGELTSPGKVTVNKGSDDIFVECQKTGYQKASQVNSSGMSSWTYANVITLGLGWGVDRISGADREYSPRVDIALVPGARRLAPDAGGLGPRTSQGFAPVTTRAPASAYPAPAQPPATAYAPLQPRSSSLAAPAQPATTAVPAPGAGASFGVWFASFDSVDQATQGWQQVWSQHWSILSGVTPYIEYGTVGNSGNRYNLYGKATTQADAARLCQNLQRRGSSCSVVYF